MTHNFDVQTIAAPPLTFPTTRREAAPRDLAHNQHAKRVA